MSWCLKMQYLSCPTELLSPTLRRNEIVQHGTAAPQTRPLQPAGVRIEAFRDTLGAGSVSVWMENLIFLSLVEAKALNLKLIY